MTDVTPTSIGSSNRWPDGLKYGSYCLTGFPLLLKIVLPLAIQRIGPCGVSGSACIFLTITLPSPSEYSKEACSGGCSPGASWLTCFSRMTAQAHAGCLPQMVLPPSIVSPK